MCFMSKKLWWILSLGWALLIWRLTTTPQIVVTQDTLLQAILMSFAHFFFFGLQAAFLSLTHFAPLPAIAITSSYGLFIEVYQRTVPGRSADPLDWFLDTLGALVFLVILNKYYHPSNTLHL
ncbi:MAG: VanZ family protein [Microgenomates group bacterium GW2011_GWC1_46_16]|nr:MAG: VanZ family protein [Microgenomates group bacterium GW2011_GWC1_46_16]KKU45372.1 MAG: VanZ family protein [Microgenomates group bacterium GW2011_GWB1_46_7]HBD02378.1 hypothetical protein [Candidatus Collierbacteria bacterium]HBO10876.1 hypothetical protein [Candidatus Collierbacteria bacterium]